MLYSFGPLYAFVWSSSGSGVCSFSFLSTLSHLCSPVRWRVWSRVFRGIQSFSKDLIAAVLPPPSPQGDVRHSVVPLRTGEHSGTGVFSSDNSFSNWSGFADSSAAPRPLPLCPPRQNVEHRSGVSEEPHGARSNSPMDCSGSSTIL